MLGCLDVGRAGNSPFPVTTQPLKVCCGDSIYLIVLTHFHSHSAETLSPARFFDVQCITLRCRRLFQIITPNLQLFSAYSTNFSASAFRRCSEPDMVHECLELPHQLALATLSTQLAHLEWRRGVYKAYAKHDFQYSKNKNKGELSF